MKIIGHRGARGLAEENTLKSIEAAFQAGADGVEVDVRVTADGVVLLSHDPFLIDPTGTKWVIRQHTYSDLLQRFSQLTTLADASAGVPDGKELRVEIKPQEPLVPIVAALQAILERHPHLAVVSFDFSLLKSLHKTMPDLPLILNEKWSSIRARYRTTKLGTNRMQMNQRWLWRGVLKAMSRSGYQVTPYTVNSPAQAARWEDYIDGIITDYPDRF